MADELLRRAARAITDLRRLATTLNEAGYPGDAIRIQGFAGTLRELENKLAEAQAKVDSEILDAPLAKQFTLEHHTQRKSIGRQRDLPVRGSQRTLVAPSTTPT